MSFGLRKSFGRLCKEERSLAEMRGEDFPDFTECLNDLLFPAGHPESYIEHRTAGGRLFRVRKTVEH